MQELMNTITTLQSNILVELARYKFLTVSQMHRLGLGKDISWIRTQAKQLTDSNAPLIERLIFSVTPRKGRVENVFFLTKRGKEALIDGLKMDENAVKMPIGNSTLFYKDYTHRKNTIDFQIAAYQWAQEQERSTYIDFFDCYFDKLGNNRTLGNLQAKNKIALDQEDYIIPDGVFMLQTAQRPYLFLFEMYDGKDTKRVLEQVKKHVRAIAQGTPSEKYNYPFAHRVILVFEFEALKDAFIERTKNNIYFSEVSPCFRCKSIEGVERDFFTGWQNLTGETIDFL